MTKLEQKLIELGYEYSLIFNEIVYVKRYTSGLVLQIHIENGKVNKDFSGIGTLYKILISDEEKLNVFLMDTKQAFNQLQSDLKELKEYE